MFDKHDLMIAVIGGGMGALVFTFTWTLIYQCFINLEGDSGDQKREIK